MTLLMKKNYYIVTLKYLLILSIVGVIICLILFRNPDKGENSNAIFDMISQDEDTEYFMEDFFNEEEYYEELKAQPSDIEGMTKYDKYSMGLSTSDGADSDLDGLTDKEEIEIHGSDPTLPSTAEDLYLDGYKVENGMDVHKYYEYEGAYVFDGNTCPEIILSAENAFDFNARVSDRTGSGIYRLQDKNVLKTYFVCFYTNYLTIDLYSIDKDLSPEDVTVYVQDFYETKAKAVKFSTIGSCITLKKKSDYDTPYVVYLVKEKGTLAKTFGSLVVGPDVAFGDAIPDVKEAHEKTSGIVYGSPLLCLLGTKLNVCYERTSSDTLNASVRDNLISVANDLQEKIQVTTEEDRCVTAADATKIELLTKLFDNWLPSFKYAGVLREEKLRNLLFVYYTYDDYLELKASQVDDKEEIPEEDWEFSFYLDVLPFDNFSTRFSGGGVCAGFAHLTSYLYNNKCLDQPKGSFTYNGQTYTWDITADPENATLLDLTLRDYKNAYFTLHHTSEDGFLEKGLTAGEKDFVNLINYYWLRGNQAFNANDYMKGIDGKDKDKDLWTMCLYDSKVIRNMTKELDAGRVVDAYFWLNNDSGHAVNIYDYEKTDTYLNFGDEGYVFYVYDNNNPDEPGTLTVEIAKHMHGKEYMFYLLNVPRVNYAASSNNGRRNLFVVLDSDFNVLSNMN